MSVLALLGSVVVVGAFGLWWSGLPVSGELRALGARRDGLTSPLELVLPYLRKLVRFPR